MKVNLEKEVWVYRNLSKGKKSRPLYSIMQNGRVIARQHRVLLCSVRFVVRESGRQRVIKEKRKNVHAFVVGYLTHPRFKYPYNGCAGTDHNTKRLGLRISYNPYKFGYFFHPDYSNKKVTSAGAVLLNENGMEGVYVRP